VQLFERTFFATSQKVTKDKKSVSFISTSMFSLPECPLHVQFLYTQRWQRGVFLKNRVKIKTHRKGRLKDE